MKNKKVLEPEEIEDDFSRNMLIGISGVIVFVILVLVL